MLLAAVGWRLESRCDTLFNPRPFCHTRRLPAPDEDVTVTNTVTGDHLPRAGQELACRCGFTSHCCVFLLTVPPEAGGDWRAERSRGRPEVTLLTVALGHLLADFTGWLILLHL